MSSLVASRPVGIRGRGERRSRSEAIRQPRAELGAAVVRTVLLAVAVIGILLAVLRVATGPFARVHHVIVSGDSPLPEQEVLLIAGLQDGEPLLSIDPGAIESRLAAVSLVRSARVEKLFPATVRLIIQRRDPVALVLGQDGARSRAALVDAEGVIFAPASEASGVDLPVLSGVPSAGERVPRRLAPLLVDLAALRQRSPRLYKLLSEIRLEGAAGASEAPGASEASAAPVDFLVYLTTAPVALRASGTLDERLVQYGLLAVDLLSRQGILKDVQELDLRGGEVVYRSVR